MTAIQWTDATWNPIVGCSRVSKGCEHCYAERVAHRGMSEQHRGLTVLGKKGPRWTGEVRFLPERLDEPLRWRKPRRVFVNSMSDLFHEGVSDEQIAAVFGVMAACPQHTFQVLTKRPERARAWFAWYAGASGASATPYPALHYTDHYRGDSDRHPVIHRAMHEDGTWPLRNVWLGVSVEDQATADERIPILLDTPAAVRWVSYEPALGPVDFDLPRCDYCGSAADSISEDGAPWCSEHECECSYGHWLDFPSDGSFDVPAGQAANGGIVWVVVGGESGPGARPFAIEWAARTVAQCRRAGTPVFVKQLGALVVSEQRVDEAGAWAWRAGLRDRKGGDPSEWPEDLRVREWPEASR